MIYIIIIKFEYHLKVIKDSIIFEYYNINIIILSNISSLHIFMKIIIERYMKFIINNKKY